MPNEEEFRRDWTLGSAGVGASALVLCAVGRAIYRFLPTQAPTPEALAPFLFDAASVRPEPAERTTYLVSLLLAPALLWGGFEALRGLALRLRRAPRWAPQAAFWASVAAAALAVARSQYGDKFFYVDGTYLIHPLAFALVAAAVYALTRRGGSATTLNRVLAAGFVALLIYGFGFRLFTGSDLCAVLNHFQAFFSSVVQTRAGRFPLVDYVTQYGLYPLFLDPFFRLTGLSVFRFTCVMSFLTAAGYALLAAFLVKTTRRPWLAFLAVGALICFADFYLPPLLGLHHVLDFYDPYFQYKPLRLLFPALACACVAWDKGPGDAAGRLFFTLVLSAGIFWNPDSGAPSLLAWLGLLSFESLFVTSASRTRGLAVIWGTAAACVGFWWTTLTLALRLASSRWPDWSMLTDLGRQFYVLGFGMLPMPPFHSWNVLVLLYAAGLLVAWISMRRGLWGARPRAILFSSALGLGLFSYYQGRSHSANLFPVATPAFCLAALFADGLLETAGNSRARFCASRAFAAFIIAVLCAFTARGAGDVPYFNASMRRRLIDRTPAYPEFERDLTFLRERTAPGDVVEFLSYRDASYYLATRTRALSGPGFDEIYKKEDADRLFAALRASANVRVFADETMVDLTPGSTRLILNSATAAFLKKYYRATSFSPSGRIAAFARR